MTDMVLTRDIDRGFSTPFVMMNFYDENEETIASLFEDEMVPIAEEGEVVTLKELSVSEDGVEEQDNLGKYRIKNRSYEYSMAVPTEEWMEEESKSDRLLVVVEYDVESVQED